MKKSTFKKNENLESLTQEELIKIIHGLEDKYEKLETEFNHVKKYLCEIFTPEPTPSPQKSLQRKPICGLFSPITNKDSGLNTPSTEEILNWLMEEKLILSPKGKILFTEENGDSTPQDTPVKKDEDRILFSPIIKK